MSVGAGAAGSPAASSSLAGKVCIVTGAQRGIGRAIAESLAAEGAHLGLCAARGAPDVAADVKARVSMRCDVSDSAQVTAFFSACESALGPPDVVVLNAGVLEQAPLEAFSEAQWSRVLDVNLKGAFLCAKAAWPAMQGRRTGRVIAIGSISGTLGTPRASAYNASKWGLTGFMKSIAEEGRAHGIFCATVLPGSVDTDMLKQTAWPPQITPAEVARVVKFLATDAPMTMTGAAIDVFG